MRIAGKILGLVFLGLFVMVSVTNEAHANNKYASIVVDAETGKVLRARNPGKILHPASLTKMMTLYMTFDALSRGQLRLKDRIPISRHAAGMPPSKLNLPVGSSIRVEDAVYALVTKSANDVAAALGEKIGGSEWAFAKKMTARARDLGMKDTLFTNASGLPDSKQVSTARDMAILARALIYNHPEYYHYFSTKNFNYRGNNYGNHNKLLTQYKGMDGIKTGYIHASGFNLVASAVRDNRRLVAVVFGGRTSKSRNAHMAEILDEGFVLAKRLPKTRVASLAPALADVPQPAKKPAEAKQDPTQAVLAALRENAPAPAPRSLATAVNTRSIPLPSPMPKAKVANVIIEKTNSKAIDEMLGQGDVDPNAALRLETGLMAMAAHTRRVAAIDGIGSYGGDANGAPAEGIPAQQVDGSKGWAVQIGAYSSEGISSQAIRVASKSLPPELRKVAMAETVPLTTGSRTIYRARMAGFDEHTAQKACAYLRNCMVIAP